MFQIGSYEGFKIFEPAPEIIPEAREQVKRCRENNERFLAGYRVGEFPMRISGSFICAHAPDYVGVPTLEWDETQWRRLFAEMRRAGMDTVVWQASIWHELEECYYHSAAFREYSQWNAVEPMLAAAKMERMQVFLGGYGSVVGWTAGLSDSAIEREIERQFGCIRELLDYHDSFCGIYFSPETAFCGERDLCRELQLNRLYREYFSRLKEIAPEKQILMSPGSKFFPGRQTEFLACWQNLLKGVPLDILAPQDSIGCACCSLADQPEMWRNWRQAADSLKLRLWANLELFERRRFGGTAPFAAASPERVAAQIANVAPWVEKCICWEYPYFSGPAPGGALLKQRIFRLS